MPDVPRPARAWGGDALVAATALLAGGALLLAHALTPRGTVENDVGYYFAWAQWVQGNGFSEVLREYPTPAAVMLWLPTLVVDTQAGYMAVFVATSLVLMVAGVLVVRSLPDRTAGRTAAVLLLACLGALGPITVYRFDLLPGLLLATAAVLLARGRSGWSVAVALGTGIKLWPVVAFPLVLGRRSTRRREVVGFVVTGAVLVLGSVAVAGWDRLLSPLTWQSGRGLQVESVLATGILLGRLVSPSTWSAALSPANSWDFSGPGVAAALAVGTALEVVAFGWVGVLSWRLWRTRAARPLDVTLAASSVVAVLLATNKVFSPQYVMWLAPVAAVAVALGRGRLPRWWGPVLVAMSFLTQLSYPLTYGWLYSGATGWHFLLGTVIMVTRNCLLVVLTVSMCLAAWRAAVPAGPGPAHVHGSPGAAAPGLAAAGPALVNESPTPQEEP